MKMAVIEPLRLGPSVIVMASVSSSSVEGAVLEAFGTPIAEGHVRLLDLVFVDVLPDGELWCQEASSTAVRLAGLSPLVPGLIGIDDVRQLAARTADSTHLIVALFEQPWLTKLSKDNFNSGGVVESIEPIPAPVLNAVLDLHNSS